MSTIVTAVMGLMLAGAFVFVYLNRASPTIVNAALPVALTALSALALVLAFNRPEPISKTFATVFVVERASQLPVSIPHRPFPQMTLILAAEMQQIDSTTFKAPEGQEEFDFIVPLYHELLQKAMVNSLALKQFGTWRTRTERFGASGFEQFGPMPDAGDYASKVFTKEELQKAFGTNRFARVHSLMGKWALPPGTDLQIEPPHTDPQGGQVGTIRLKNRFCEITVRTFQSLSLVGLGQYRVLLGVSMDRAQDEYKTLQYVTRINASFPWYLIGHPDMAVHRAWANGIIEELVYAFDEEGLWQRSTDSFMLYRHLPPPFPPGNPLPIGPTRMMPRKPTPAAE